jgi:uncharacterized protein (DUF1778 family)
MKPRLNDQLFARCTPADRKKVERAARLGGYHKTSEFIRDSVITRAEGIIANLAPSKELAS